MTDGQSSDDGGFADHRSTNDPSVQSSSMEDQVICHINDSKDDIAEIETDVQDQSSKQNGTPKHNTSNGKEPKKKINKKKDKNKLDDAEQKEKTSRKPNKLSAAFQRIKDLKRWSLRSPEITKEDVETGISSKNSTVNHTDNEKEAKIDKNGLHAESNMKKSKEEKKENEANEIEAKTGEESSKNEEKQTLCQKLMALPTRTRILVTGSLLFLFLLLIVIVVLSQMPAKKQPTQTKSSGRTSKEPVAVTSCGLVRGKIGAEDSFEFYGIPYAMPPIRNHRFKPPRTPSNLDECWQGTMNVIFPAPLCPQSPISGMPGVKYSEDCLTLDVMSPTLSPYTPLPVVVYIPGMSILGFTETDMKYAPSGMLADELKSVFVTIRYRTGVFGFMATDTFAQDSYPRVSGNYGLHDIIAALKWVKTNIRNFGGDPEHVTVVGHGSSASLILSLMGSPKLHYQHREIREDFMLIRRKLFHKAWLSGGSVNFPNQTLQQSYAENSEFMDNLKCRTVQCVYQSSVSDILAATPTLWKNQYFLEVPSKLETYPRIIVADGEIIQNTPVEAMEKQKMAKIPTVFGSILHEYEPAQAPNLNSWEDFSSFIRTKFQVFDGNLAEDVIKLYTDNTSSPLRQYYSIVTDIRITCPIQQFAQRYAKYSDKESVYKYLVHYEYSTDGNSTQNVDVTTGTHGLDIAAIFRQLPEFLNNYSIKSEWLLEATMQQTFFDFVYRNHERYDLKPSKYLNLIGNDGRLKPTMGIYDKCKLWNKSALASNYGRVN